MVGRVTQREVLREKRRFFGWFENYVVPDQIEANAILRATLDVLDGTASLQDIANRWNADPDINTIFGGIWHYQVVERILRRASNVPLLVDRGPHAQLVQRLDSEAAARLPSPAVARQRRWQEFSGLGSLPLTHAALCSVCGERVVSKTYTSGPRTWEMYRCRVHSLKDHPLRRDGRRHGSCEVAVLDAAVRAEMALVLPGGAAEYDALDVAQKRAAVREHLRVLVHPAYTSEARYSIERKP